MKALGACCSVRHFEGSNRLLVSTDAARTTLPTALVTVVPSLTGAAPIYRRRTPIRRMLEWSDLKANARATASRELLMGSVIY
jgi:hypothetical protein